MLPKLQYYAQEKSVGYLVVERISGSLEKALKVCSRRFSINTIYMVLEEVLGVLITLEETARTVSSFDLGDWFLGKKDKGECLYLIDPLKICQNTETNFKSALFCIVNMLKKISPRSRFLNLLLQNENAFYRSKKNFTDFKNEILEFMRSNFDIDSFIVRERLYDWVLVPYSSFALSNGATRQKEEIEPIDADAFNVDAFLEEYEKVSQEHVLQIKDINALYELNVDMGSSKKMSMRTLASPKEPVIGQKTNGKKVCHIF